MVAELLRADSDFSLHNYDSSSDQLTKLICTQLESVYDPEFPLVDIFTLGLIYSIVVDSDEQLIEIVMSYTSPACPEGERIQEMMKQSIAEKLPHFEVLISLSFNPLRSLEMVRDPDLKKLLY